MKMQLSLLELRWHRGKMWPFLYSRNKVRTVFGPFRISNDKSKSPSKSNNPPTQTTYDEDFFYESNLMTVEVYHLSYLKQAKRILENAKYVFIQMTYRL